jgi:chitinase
MVDVVWSEFEGDRPAYFNPYGLGYPVGSPSDWASGGRAEWPAGSGPDTGEIYVIGSDDMSGYDPATDILVFGFRDGDAVTEMGAHNYCVLWTEQPDGNYTLSVMPVSIWESQEPIASITDIDPADLPTLIKSWAPTNNHFQDDLVASAYAIDPASDFPDNQIVVKTGVAGETTTYDFAAMQALYGDDIVLNFTTFSGREMKIEYDDASDTMTISHFGDSWGGYNDVWGKTVITNVEPSDLDGLEQLWRYDSALEDGRLQKDRFNTFLEDNAEGGDGGAGTDPNLMLVIDHSSSGMDHVHLHGEDAYIRVDVDADDLSVFIDDNGYLNLKVDSTGFVAMVMVPTADELVDTLSQHIQFADADARTEVEQALATLTDTGGETGGETGGDTGGETGGETGGGTPPDPTAGEILYAANNGDLAYEVRSSWTGGFVADLSFTPDAAVGSWQIAFTLDAEITNIWNARIVSHEGSTYVVENVSYNGSVGAGQTTGFGFQGSGAAEALTAVTLNGAAAPYDGEGTTDPEPVLPELTIHDTLIDEDAGTATFMVHLSEASDSDVTVDFTTANGSATAGADYVANSGTLTIAAGATMGQVTVDLIDDGDVEAAETFSLALSDAHGATIADGTAVGTIQSDDVAPVVPDVSILDASVNEEDGAATFTVRLSEAADGDVTIDFETVAGTAEAGSDFVAKTGSLVIAAGETEGTVTVDIADDTAVEADETFQVRLTGADGATLSDATATATIVSDDVIVPTDPQVTVSSGHSVSEAAAGGGGGASTFADGPLSTSGNEIVDSAGNAVEIRAVNWFGMETDVAAPHGLWARNWQDMMDQMKEEGFNAIRLPFSGELVATGGNPQGIDYSKNPDLAGLSGMEIMDKIVGYADAIDMKILLDHHRVDAGNGAESSGLWYNGEYSQQDWIDQWTELAERYADNDAVIGADLHNEPHGQATWGDGGPTDWALAAETAGNAILEVNPDWLIVVEGIGDYQGDNYWWGGNLQGVADRPVVLSQDDKLVYSPHDYPASVYAQPWFFDGSDLSEVFSEHWGFIHEQGIAPILMGEFGSKLETDVDRAWADAIVRYLDGDYDLDGVSDLDPGASGMSWAWWSWNPNSGDTGGILNDDWTTVRQNAIGALDPLLQDEGGGSDGGPSTVTFTVSLDQAYSDEVTVSFETLDGTALSGQDYQAVSGDLVFAAGETEKTVTVALIDDADNEGNETFQLAVSTGTSQSVGTATILDDDDGGDTGGSGGSGETDGTGGTGGDGELSFELKIVNDWGSGAQYEIAIANDGDAAIDGWHLGIDLPFEITQLWNGTIVEATEGHFAIENAAWNGSLAPGQEISFGFIADEGNFDLDALLRSADAELFAA